MTPLADDRHPSALIVGAGIAGMAAATHLAHLGLSVHLLDTAPSIGGSLHLLDHTFPTNSCGLCLMLPHQPAFCPTFECDLHPNIHLLPYHQLLHLDSLNANGRHAFSASIRRKARFVDPSRCSGCGDCAAVCPELRPHDLEGWLSPLKAIYHPPGLRAVPDAWLIDSDACTRCGRCVQACPTGAIDLDMQDQSLTLQTGAVLLTPGFAPFDARLKGEFGFQVYDNVLSASQFERMVSLAGSSVAHLRRPSDGATPRKIAFVHCVGSRDLRPSGPSTGRPSTGYCSSACCMFTAKQVALAKQIQPDLDITVFFMDLRALGKDFETYLDRVQALPGVSYRRAMPSSVHQLQQSRDLLVTSVGDDARLHEERFDLLVLATGLAPPQGMQRLARHLDLTLNDFGFAVTNPYHPTRSSRHGLFVAGAFREPKDIPDTVTEAAAAAAEVAAFLAADSSPGEPPPGPDTGPPAAYPYRDVSDEEPRVGVFVCHCNDGPPPPAAHGLQPIDPHQLVDRTRALHGVALAQLVPQGCSAEGQTAIQTAIDAHQLNRVVVAGCSHRLFTDTFQQLMHAAGLDPRLLARVNLREQVTYPHLPTTNGPDHLNAKARSLIAMAVASLRTMTGLQALTLGAQQSLTRRALVVGGGAAGLSAALLLARLQIPVHLLEQASQLGGQWRHIRYQAETLALPHTPAPQQALADLIAQVQAHPLISLHLDSQLTALEGTPGDYQCILQTHDQQTSLHVGVLLIATGGQPATPTEYLYDQDPRVLTQRELEQQIADGTLATVRSVVMIQCVGSREPDRPYCSRVCCTQAVKNALQLKQHNPNLDLYILYRDLRTFGCRESLYQAARDAGVVFLRYQLPAKPTVQANGKGLLVSLPELLTGQPLTLPADLLVLSTGIQATPNHNLAHTLDLDLNPDGFFAEEHPKMKPLDLPRQGLYVAGLAHSPRFLDETIAQAQGAAMRAAAFLAPTTLTDRPTAVWVNPRLCSFCGLCVEACPFQARQMNYDTRVADVDYALCQGCGVCAMACPNKATLQKTFEHKQLMAAIDMALV